MAPRLSKSTFANALKLQGLFRGYHVVNPIQADEPRTTVLQGA